MGFSLKHIDFSYGDKAVICDFSLDLPSCGITALNGPSGCGKTTLLRILAGLETPQKGQYDLPKRASMVFQEDRLLSHMTLLENVAAVSNADRAKMLLEALNLADAADLYPKECSGGMCRRAAIARALAYDGDALLLDEPFTGLDRENALRVVEMIRGVAEQKPVVLVTHDAEWRNILESTIIEMGENDDKT